MSDKLSKVLLAHGAVGREAEEFLQSDLGKTIIGLARQEAVANLSQLRTVSSWRRRKIQELQAAVWRAESFEGWLQTLIARGQQAVREFDRRTEVMTEESEDGSYHPEHAEE